MQFLYPSFLLLLPLGLIPVLIHIFTRLRLQRRGFPSLALLESVRRERWSWFRLREILLLVLRTLFLLLIPLALSRPRLESRLPFRLGSDRMLLILDHSYSMAYGNRWQQALESARRIIHSSSRPMLILSSQPDTVISGRNTLLALLDTLSASALAPTLEPALSRAAGLYRQTPMPVITITDLQARAVPENIPIPGGQLQIINLGSNRFDNAGITGITYDRRQLRIRIFNYGRTPVIRTVRLKLEGYQEEKVVNIPARSAVFAEFSLPSDLRHHYSGIVELSSDSLTLDDRRFFALATPSRLSVPIFVSAENQGKYLQLALATDTLQFLPLLLNISALRRTDLTRYQTIIIADAGALRPADWERLDFYLNSGGSALLCAPSLTNGSIPLPLRYEGQVSHLGFITPAEVDTTHPVLSGLRTVDLNAVRVYYHSRITGGRTLIRLASRDPLVIELPEKNLLIWTFAPVPEATDLVYRAAFVPLLYQTLKYLTGRNRQNEWQTGDTVLLAVDNAEPLRLLTPAGEKTVFPEPGGIKPVVKIIDTRLPGIYRLENGQYYEFAVNPLPEEGDLTPAPLEPLIRNGIKIYPPRLYSAGELTGPLLYFAGILLALEFLLLGFESYRKTPVRK
ncbi:MAG: VWA domain-containing protein [candidate division WOR-3 bacterium]